MTVERTLAKVDEDLRTGDVAMARRRLKSLVESLPHELDARERLAEVCRLDGDRTEAGRWSYLSEQRDPAEVDAFERACGRDPVRIMQGLRWRGPEEQAASELARQRLLEIRARAESAAGKKLDWSDRERDVSGPWWEGLTAVGCAIVGLMLVGLVVVGAVTVFRWIV
ncbi:DUF6584 family protein [Cellulomonas sp. Root137]|uniref:DUF6584 family protein n=1 Tax=Cellulomonas sp. Root137 TaxID=1736459 RepID=UPI000713BF72|nr:DUF6584 family protein [Cellulomonas sp. Root137]KQY42858.1 hypothetical protein ASD18_17890 [Cellulomonas sp. Root137]